MDLWHHDVKNPSSFTNGKRLDLNANDLGDGGMGAYYLYTCTSLSKGRRKRR